MPKQQLCYHDKLFLVVSLIKKKIKILDIIYTPVLYTILQHLIVNSSYKNVF